MVGSTLVVPISARDGGLTASLQVFRPASGSLRAFGPIGPAVGSESKVGDLAMTSQEGLQKTLSL